MEVKKLTKIYTTEYDVVKALDNMNLEFSNKGLVFIVGVSGSGKSTLMNMLSGVDTPTEGEVIIQNKSLFKEDKNELFGYRNSYVGLIFQDCNLIEDINVYDNIKLPLELLGETDFSIIDEIIKKVDIEEIKYSNVNEISSGQMQRVAIARALVKNSAMILADEPTGNLDSKNTKIVMDLLQEISKDRLVVVITHDDEAAMEYGDRIIEIEDGKILEDHLENPEINNDTNVVKKAEFVEPKISFKKQVTFTTSFVRNNLARSIAIFLLIVLIPFIGNIMAGYVFYDVSHSFKTYQEEYGSEFVELAAVKSGYSVVYSDTEDSFEYYDLINKYISGNKMSQLIEVYGINSKIKNTTGVEESYFYKNVVRNLIQDDIYDFTYLEGYEPVEEDEIAITDYLNECYNYYTGDYKNIGDKISINGVKFTICGIVKTSYSNFLNYDQSDLFTSLAFQENLEYYNAFYVSSLGRLRWWEDMTYFVEDVKYTPRTVTITQKPEPVYTEITIRKKDNYSPSTLAGTANYTGKNGTVSKKLWTDLMQRDADDVLISSTSLAFICSARTKYTFSMRTSAYYDSSTTSYEDKADYEIVCSQARFDSYKEKQRGCRFLVSVNDPNYKQIVNNENVHNPAFTYAKATWDRAESIKYIMIEFLLTFILISAVFAFIINSITMNSEKKKIGIKYSFGIKKGQIIVPYLLELGAYIVVGFVLSTLLTKFVFPAFMKLFIYTTAQERSEYYFYYIGWGSLLGWDFVIYLIMIVSLLYMVYKICKKSPIEIIKDL